MAFHFDVDNGIPISSFTDDKSDKELFKLDFILESLAVVNDVRQYIPLFIQGQEINFNKAKDIFLVDKRHLDPNPPLLKRHSINYAEEMTLVEKKFDDKYFSNYTQNTQNTENEENTKNAQMAQNMPNTRVDETEQKKIENKSKDSIEDKKHHKSKTISSIFVKPCSAKGANIGKLTQKKNSLKQFQTEGKQLRQVEESQTSRGVNNGISLNYFTMQNNSRSKNRLNSKNKGIDSGAFYNISQNSKNSSSQKRASFTNGSTQSTSNSKKSFDNQYNPKGLLGEKKILNYSVESRFKNYLFSENSKKSLSRSLNKSNVRENSKSSLQTKYSKNNPNIKINKISRNFKIDTPSGKSNKSLKYNPNTSQNKSLRNSVNKSTSKNPPNKSINNKILGVKVFQVKKQLSFGQPHTMTSSKDKYSPWKQIKSNELSRQKNNSLSKQSTGKSKGSSKGKSLNSTTPSYLSFTKNLLNTGTMNYASKSKAKVNSNQTCFNNINIIKIDSNK